MTCIPSLGGRLRLGAGWCNAPSPVLRGAGDKPMHGRDRVAPPGNQAATEKTNFGLNLGEEPAYSPVHIFPRVYRADKPSISAGFPPLPEPRMAALRGGAVGRRLSPNGGKLFERSEFFRRPLKVGSLGVSTAAGRPSLGYFSWPIKKRNSLPGDPRPNTLGLRGDRKSTYPHGPARREIPPAPHYQRGVTLPCGIGLTVSLTTGPMCLVTSVSWLPHSLT